MKRIFKYIVVFFVWTLSLVRRIIRGRRRISLSGSRCLIISVSGIGNAVMATPLIQALKVSCGAAVIDVLTSGASHATLFRGIRFCNSIYLYPKTGWDRLKLVHSIRRNKYDLLLLAFPTPEIHYTLLVLAVNAYMVISHDYGIYHPFFRFLKYVADHIISVNKNLHDIEQNANLVHNLTDHTFIFKSYPPFIISDLAVEQAQHFYRDKNIGMAETVCFIHPGSKRGTDYKRWPLDRFIALGHKLKDEHNLIVIVILGPDEEEHRNLFEQHGFITTLFSFSTTLAILQRGSMLISNDSGMMHVASMMRVPTVTIWGGTDMRRNGARGNKALNIVNDSVRCRPCVRFAPDIHCPAVQFECIQSISVDQVYQGMLQNGFLSIKQNAGKRKI
ncbi:glycosyltransferase family 9 protein [candidate division KSB1 bacterium]|nr:glycosyltransferase family 9 protein [candidate division KSB1 bacterium]RQW00960.1 MAG: glycosyltransferase family 9 protein [candidate division KSB1 bacterium]